MLHFGDMWLVTTAFDHFRMCVQIAIGSCSEWLEATSAHLCLFEALLEAQNPKLLVDRSGVVGPSTEFRFSVSVRPCPCLSEQPAAQFPNPAHSPLAQVLASARFLLQAARHRLLSAVRSCSAFVRFCWTQLARLS